MKGINNIKFKFLMKRKISFDLMSKSINQRRHLPSHPNSTAKLRIPLRVTEHLVKYLQNYQKQQSVIIGVHADPVPQSGRDASL